MEALQTKNESQEKTGMRREYKRKEFGCQGAGMRKLKCNIDEVGKNLST